MESRRTRADDVEHDAFLSHAWEDKPTVRWLADVLARHWVPFRRRRDVYVDEHRMSSGSVPAALRDALNASRHLIVCLSPDAIASTWVDQELAWWLDDGDRAERLSRLHLCWVGGPVDLETVAIPTAISDRGEDAWFRDRLIVRLDAAPDTWSTAVAKTRRDDALALLAPLLGFTDKQDVVAHGRKQLLRATVALLAVLAGGLGIDRAIASWRTTPSGRFDTTVEALVADAAANESNLVYVLFDCVTALGRAGMTDAVDALAGAIVETTIGGTPNGLRRPVLLAGHASAPTLDTARVEALASDRAGGLEEQWQRARWLAERRLGRTEPTGIAILDARAIADLAWAGWHAKARAGISALPAATRLDAAVELALAAGTELDAEDASVDAWITAHDDGLDRIDACATLLTRLDRGGVLCGPTARLVLDRGLAAVERVYAAGFGIPSQDQTLAALAVPLGRAAAATSIVDRTAASYDLASEASAIHHQPTGWAWRALTLSRLGRDADARAAFERAEAEGRIELFASRTWGEWRDIVLVYVLADDWPRTFAACDGPRDARVRFELRCLATELFCDRVIATGREAGMDTFLRGWL